VWPLNNRSIQRHIRNVAHSSSVYPDGFPSVHRPTQGLPLRCRPAGFHFRAHDLSNDLISPDTVVVAHPGSLGRGVVSGPTNLRRKPCRRQSQP
jgi:hypothetical protein